MIAGYIIVRKPIYNEISLEGTILKPINKIYYHGVNRLTWYDIEGDYFSGKLPGNLKTKYFELSESGNDFTFIKLLKDFDDAKALLNSTEEVLLKNEIIAVSSLLLNEIKGEFPDPYKSFFWLGYDVVLLGGWSLIRHGIFENQQYSLLEEKQLNEYGLFDDLQGIDNFFERI